MGKMVSPFVRIYLLFILFIFFNNSPLVAQVIIEEEVVLDSSLSIESQTLTIPFYGNISGCVNWAAMWWGWLKDVVIEAGGQSVTMGFGCGAGYTVCSWSLKNISTYSPVNITVYDHCENDVLIEGQTQVIETGENQYEVQYMYHGNWSLATTVLFSETVPPECAYICQSEINTQMPNTIVRHIDPSVTEIEECEDKDPLDGSLVLGQFHQTFKQNESSNIYDFDLNDVDACYDDQQKKWIFGFNTPDLVSLNVVNSLCIDNILNYPAEIINDVSEIDLLSDDKCDVLKRSLIAHETYPLSDKIKNGYVFTEILYTHENEHEKDWLAYKDKFYDDYFNIPDKILYTNCLDFSTLTDAKTTFLSSVKRLFWYNYYYKVLISYSTDHYLLLPRTEEEEEFRIELEKKLHSRDEIQVIINKYKEKIITKCGSLLDRSSYEEF